MKNALLALVLILTFAVVGQAAPGPKEINPGPLPPALSTAVPDPQLTPPNQHGITLGWVPSISTSVVGTIVYTSTDGGVTYIRANATPVTAAGYFFPTPTLDGISVSLKVTAVDNLGIESVYSNVVTVKAKGNPNPNTGVTATVQ